MLEDLEEIESDSSTAASKDVAHHRSYSMGKKVSSVHPNHTLGWMSSMVMMSLTGHR